jgi:hypothetical protein
MPLFRAFALLLLAAVALRPGLAAAKTLPEPVVRGDYQMQRVGAGQLSWLGRPVYEASLWTPGGRFEGYIPGEPVALSLWYQRDFSRDELIRITSTAWRLLGSVPPAQRERWITTLRTFWSDVGPGQNVTTVVIPGRATRFYDHRGFMGQVDDPAFGPAFLSIWLDPSSVVGDLRVQLLGIEPTVARR